MTEASASMSIEEDAELWADLDMSDPQLQEMLDHPIPEKETGNLTLRTTEQHVGFDDNMGDTWIYPNNLPCRSYQLSITKAALYHNTLVVLPTGLGKTLIAAVVMYNIYRWYPKGKVIFMAPTRPLVAQQIEACQRIMPFPDKDTVELTGRLPRAKRHELWRTKRVFFATPQVVRSDIVGPIAPDGEDNATLDGFEFPYDTVKLLVVDEAHKAKGRYAYTEVAQAIFNRNRYFRMLALSATPGRTTDDVAEVVRNLFISRLEVRWEQSIDVLPFVHQRTLKKIVVRLSPEIRRVRDELLLIIDPYVRQLIDADVLSGSKGNINRNSLLFEQKRFRERSQRHPQQAAIGSNFSICISLYHSVELLERHGLRVFLNNFEEDEEGRAKFVVALDGRLRALLGRVRDEVGPNPFNVSASNMTNGLVAEMPADLDFGHPKFEEARSCLLQHFEAHPESRAIVFCEYRESVMLIYRLLLQHKPTLRARCFVGQGGSTGSLRALTQKKQIEIMADFRTGKSNILIATSVGEEGIDVGEVELIVCFDISTSNPTRFVQRIGRTGRERPGNVVMLVTEGREQQLLQDVLRQKDQTNRKLLQSQAVKAALYQHAPRLVPTEYNPQVVHTYIKPPAAKEEKKPKAAKKPVPTEKVTKKGKKGTKTTAIEKPRDERVDALLKSSQAFRQYFNSRDKRSSFDFGPCLEPTQSLPPGLTSTPTQPSQLSDRIAIEAEVRRECEPSGRLRGISRLPEVVSQPAPSDRHLRNVNKLLQQGEPLLPAATRCSDLLAQLRSKLLTREAKLCLLRGQAKFVREADENMAVLGALDLAASEMTEKEQTVRRTYEQIVEFFGSADEMRAFLEQADYEDFKQKCNDTPLDEEADGFDEARFQACLKTAFDDCKQLDFSCDRFDWIQQRLRETHRYGALLKARSAAAERQNEKAYQESMVYECHDRPDEDCELINITDSAVFDVSKFEEFARPAERQSTPRADGPLARAFKRQREHETRSVAQLFAKVDDKNAASRAAHDDDVVVVLDCDEPLARLKEPPAAAATSAVTQPEVDLLLNDVDMWDSQVGEWERLKEEPKEAPQLPLPTPDIDKKAHIEEQQEPKEKPAQMPPELASASKDPFFDPFSVDDELFASLDLTANAPSHAQKPLEEPKDIGGSRKENRDSNNCLIAREMRQSPDMFALDETKSPQVVTSKLSLAAKLAAKVALSPRVKLDAPAKEPGRPPSSPASKGANSLQPPATASATTSPSICDRYLKKLKTRGTPQLRGALSLCASSTPLPAADAAAAQTSTAEVSVIGAGLRKKSTKRKIFDDVEESEEEEDAGAIIAVANDSTDCEEAIAFTQKQQTQQEVRERKRLKRLQAQPMQKRRRLGACPFLAEEAAVSGSDQSDDEDEHTIGQYKYDTVVVSSDGEEHSGELPPTQMQAVYLQSLKSPPQKRPGLFKIPAFRLFNDRSEIFSQAPTLADDASQYAIDSFVVNEYDDEQKRSERRKRKAARADVSLCPLERAEKLLKEERRLKRLQRRQQRLLDSSDDECA